MATRPNRNRDRLVQQADDYVMSLCDKPMSKRDAVAFLDEVITRMETARDVLKEEIGDGD